MPPKVTEVILDSGIRVHVAPLSRHQRNALVNMAEKIYPLPDKAPFEVELSEDVAIPGMKIPAEENPDYRKAVADVERQRADYTSDGLLNLCLSYPDFDSRQALIDHFAPYLEEQRAWMELPDDAWDATLRFGIIRSVADENEIMSIAKDELPVTEKEVNDNVRIFRPAISREKSRIVDYARKHPSRLTSEVPGEK